MTPLDVAVIVVLGGLPLLFVVVVGIDIATLGGVRRWLDRRQQ